MFMTWLPRPLLSRVGDSLNLAAGKLLATRLQLAEIPILQPVANDDSHGNSLLWRWGANRVLRATTVRHGVNGSLIHAWDLLEACRDIQGIPHKWHPRPAWEYEGFFWTLLDWLPGESWDPWKQLSLSLFEDASNLIGLILVRSTNLLGSKFGILPCVKRRRELSASLSVLLGRFQEEREPPAVLTRLAVCLENRMGEFNRLAMKLPETGPLIVVHGDPRPSNFIVGPSGEFGLSDFNNCRLDHPASDLARLISGLPGVPRSDALTVDLARTNRWGSMVQWFAKCLETRCLEPKIESRLNELMTLDRLDK